MKKLFVLLLIVMSLQGFAQIVCPPHIPHFDFTFNTVVIAGQKVGGVSYCEPDTLQTDAWSIEDPLNLFTINNNGDILVLNPDVINANGTYQYDFLVRITDNGAPPLDNYSTITMYAIKPNEPPVIIAQ